MGGGRVYVRVEECGEQAEVPEAAKSVREEPGGGQWLQQGGRGSRRAREYLQSSWGFCGDRVLRIRSALPCQIVNPQSQEVEGQGANEPLRQRIPTPSHTWLSVAVPNTHLIPLLTTFHSFENCNNRLDCCLSGYIHTPALYLTSSDVSHHRTSPSY